MSINSRIEVSINFRIKTPLDHRSKGSVLQGESCSRVKLEKETVGIGILVTSTSRNGDRKIMQPIRITSGPAARMRKSNQSNQFR